MNTELTFVEIQEKLNTLAQHKAIIERIDVAIGDTPLQNYFRGTHVHLPIGRGINVPSKLLSYIIPFDVMKGLLVDAAQSNQDRIVTTMDELNASLGLCTSTCPDPAETIVVAEWVYKAIFGDSLVLRVFSPDNEIRYEDMTINGNPATDAITYLELGLENEDSGNVLISWFTEEKVSSVTSLSWKGVEVTIPPLKPEEEDPILAAGWIYEHNWYSDAVLNLSSPSDGILISEVLINGTPAAENPSYWLFEQGDGVIIAFKEEQMDELESVSWRGVEVDLDVLKASYIPLVSVDQPTPYTLLLYVRKASVDYRPAKLIMVEVGEAEGLEYLLDEDISSDSFVGSPVVVLNSVTEENHYHLYTIQFSTLWNTDNNVYLSATPKTGDTTTFQVKPNFDNTQLEVTLR